MSSSRNQILNLPDAVYDATLAERRAEHSAGPYRSSMKKHPIYVFHYLFIYNSI